LNILCRSAGVKDGDVEKVKYLIKYGAKLDLTDKGDEKCLKVLISAGSKLDIPDKVIIIFIISANIVYEFNL
jgi:hypothetical protein